MSNLDKIKLEIYEQLDAMNECCHNKGKGADPWSFQTRETKKHCKETFVETEYSYSSPVRTTCPACEFGVKKLAILNKKYNDC